MLVIPAGQASGAVTIVPLWDGIGEGPETVSLQLGAGPTNYRLGTPNSATITLDDAGDPPFVDVLGVDNAVEGGATGRFRFTLRGSAASNVVVNYTLSGTATSGSDFTALPGSVTLSGNGINTVDINVTPSNDTLPEDLETITLTITPEPDYQVYPPTGSATIWMMDNEQPTLFVDAHQHELPAQHRGERRQRGVLHLALGQHRRFADGELQPLRHRVERRGLSTALRHDEHRRRRAGRGHPHRRHQRRARRRHRNHHVQPGTGRLRARPVGDALSHRR